MDIVWAIIVGFFAGVIAKLVTPGGPKPRGFILTTVLGIVVLGEKLTWYEPLGAVIVLGGVWLAQRKPKVLDVEAKAAHA